MIMVDEISIQYAKAIYELGVEEKTEKETIQELNQINVILHENEDTMKVFLSPRVSKKEKKELIQKVFSSFATSNVLSFLYVLIDHERLEYLPSICDAYVQLQNKELHQIELDVYSKYPLSSDELDGLTKQLENYYQNHVVLNTHLDETLLAGVRIEKEGQVIEANLHQRLNDLKNNLKKGY